MNESKKMNFQGFYNTDRTKLYRNTIKKRRLNKIRRLESNKFNPLTMKCPKSTAIPLSFDTTTNPGLQLITEAFRSTLGNHPQMHSKDITLLQFDAHQRVSDKYREYLEEVNQFCYKLEIFTSLPENELQENLKNRLDVLLLRSCWWFANRDPTDTLPVIRVSGKYGLHREHNRNLEPIFAFAETMKEMRLTEIELSLAVTYCLLLGNTTFVRNPKTLTAEKRDDVLCLLLNYQKETFPNDNSRYLRLLINLSELTYISGNY